MGDCIFCKIAAGEIPSERIYENERLIAILDAFPANKGHVLIIPKRHIENAFEIDASLAAEAFSLAVKIAGIVKEQDFAEGVNILQNNGKAAGQTVFHFHIHVIPRFLGDGVSVCWKTASVSDSEKSVLAKSMADRLK